MYLTLSVTSEVVMPAHRLLPDEAILRQWVNEGLSHQQIADRTYRETGNRVSRSSVSAAVSRMGLSTPTNRYREELPWRVKTRHIRAYPARMLRLLGRRRSGQRLNEEEDKRLTAWLNLLDEENAVVAYDPDSEQGFFYVDRKRGDSAEIPIRVKRVYT